MKILYFAWLRAKLDLGEEEVSPPPEVTNVGQLVEWLKSRSPAYAEAFANPGQIRAAVNLDFAHFDHRVNAGDEVAFFPPVTGG